MLIGIFYVLTQEKSVSAQVQLYPCRMEEVTLLGGGVREQGPAADSLYLLSVLSPHSPPHRMPLIAHASHFR